MRHYLNRGFRHSTALVLTLDTANISILDIFVGLKYGDRLGVMALTTIFYRTDGDRICHVTACDRTWRLTLNIYKLVVIGIMGLLQFGFQDFTEVTK